MWTHLARVPASVHCEFRRLVEGSGRQEARDRILARLEAVKLGNLGDVKSVGEGIRELRIHFGPGCRVYFTQRGRTVLLLVCGGDKSTQTRDIAIAHRLLKGIAKE